MYNPIANIFNAISGSLKPLLTVEYIAKLGSFFILWLCGVERIFDLLILFQILDSDKYLLN